MTLLLLLFSLATLQQPGQKQAPPLLIENRQDNLLYYSITYPMTKHWGSFTGMVDTTTGREVWFAVCGSFPKNPQPRPYWFDLNGSRYYVSNLDSLGNNLAIFQLSLKYEAANGFAVPNLDILRFGLGLKETFSDSAFYLPEKKWYKVVGGGSLDYEDPVGDLNGLFVVRSSAQTDCGSGYLFHGRLFIAVRVFEGVTFKGQKSSRLTLIAPTPKFPH